LGVKFSGWQLLMVAPKRDAPDALDLEIETKCRNIADSVKYLGKIDHEDMPTLMRVVDAFILPSHNEGLSNAVIEAMATGLPVIATDVGGHREFIDSGVNGILIRPNNNTDIIAAIEKIIGDEEYRIEIASRARKGAQLIGSYNQNAMKLIAVFKRFLKAQS